MRAEDRVCQSPERHVHEEGHVGDKALRLKVGEMAPEDSARRAFSRAQVPHGVMGVTVHNEGRRDSESPSSMSGKSRDLAVTFRIMRLNGGII